jgi:hypothetical protein
VDRIYNRKKPRRDTFITSTTRYRATYIGVKMEFDDIIKLGRRESKLGKELFATIEDRTMFLTRLPGENGGFTTTNGMVIGNVNGYPRDQDLVIKLYNFRDDIFSYKMMPSPHLDNQHKGEFHKGTGREQSIRIMIPKEYDVELLI